MRCIKLRKPLQQRKQQVAAQHIKRYVSKTRSARNVDTPVSSDAYRKSEHNVAWPQYQICEEELKIIQEGARCNPYIQEALRDSSWMELAQ